MRRTQIDDAVCQARGCSVSMRRRESRLETEAGTTRVLHDVVITFFLTGDERDFLQQHWDGKRSKTGQWDAADRGRRKNSSVSGDLAWIAGFLRMYTPISFPCLFCIRWSEQRRAQGVKCQCVIRGGGGRAHFWPAGADRTITRTGTCTCMNNVFLRVCLLTGRDALV